MDDSDCSSHCWVQDTREKKNPPYGGFFILNKEQNPPQRIVPSVGLDYSAWTIQDKELRRRLDCNVQRGLLELLAFLHFMFTPFRVDDGDGTPMSPCTLQGPRLLLLSQSAKCLNLDSFLNAWWHTHPDR